MITFGDCSKESRKETEKWLDPQLWHACAGGMVQMPAVNSKVYYFPQGHAEHAQGSADFGNCMIPALILCMVAGVKFLADPETDEVYAKMELVPTRKKDYGEQQDEVLVSNHHGSGSNNASEKPVSFSKTLTQSDANNGGGFSVPRYCAETIFPTLDYTADPPVQTVVAKDVLGNIWSFRHIYRGTPRRHLLTTGWSTFVNQKKLVAGDSIVFMRTDKGGDLCVGIRRAKRAGAANGGPESPSPSGWNPAAGTGTGTGVSPYGGMFSIFLREDDTKLLRNGISISGRGLKGGTGTGTGTVTVTGTGRVRPESVTEAATLAANGHPFEVVYYPRASTPEFCVKAASVRAAMRIQWCSGLRFKMPFETEDSSRISWFMGTISSVQVADPVHWPNSPWRLLQVAWDEPDLLQNVKRVSPWLIELVSNMPIHLTPFSPPRKKLRLPSHHDFLLDSQLPMPTFSKNPLGSSSPLCCPSDNTPASIQGARHVQYGISLTDLHLNKLQSGLFPASFQRLDRTAPPSRVSTGLIVGSPNVRENVSCLLTMGNSSQNVNKPDDGKRTHFVLFGQPILTQQQISRGCSGDAVSSVLTTDSSSDGHPDKPANLLSNGPQGNLSSEGFPWYKGQRASELGLETSHCKVFMESEDVGRTLDLSVLGSYEELYRRLANMFGIERSGMLSQVLYRDAKGTVKQTGDEPFSEFMKTARRLTILMDSGSDNIGRQIQPIHVSV